MKITIEHCGNKISYEVSYEDVSLDKMLDILECLLKADGYSFTGNLNIVEEDQEEEPNKSDKGCACYGSKSIHECNCK